MKIKNDMVFVASRGYARVNLWDLPNETTTAVRRKNSFFQIRYRHSIDAYATYGCVYAAALLLYVYAHCALPTLRTETIFFG